MIDRNLDDLDSLTESAGGSSPRRIVLWLVIASLLVLLLPLFLVSNALKDENVRMQQEMEAIQATLDSPVPVPAEEQTLRNEMLQSREAETVLENLRANLESRHLNWPDTMLTLGQLRSHPDPDHRPRPDRTAADDHRPGRHRKPGDELFASPA